TVGGGLGHAQLLRFWHILQAHNPQLRGRAFGVFHPRDHISLQGLPADLQAKLAGMHFRYNGELLHRWMHSAAAPAHPSKWTAVSNGWLSHHQLPGIHTVLPHALQGHAPLGFFQTHVWSIFIGDITLALVGIVGVALFLYLAQHGKANPRTWIEPTLRAAKAVGARISRRHAPASGPEGVIPLQKSWADAYAGILDDEAIKGVVLPSSVGVAQYLGTKYPRLIEDTRLQQQDVYLVLQAQGVTMSVLADGVGGNGDEGSGALASRIVRGEFQQAFGAQADSGRRRFQGHINDVTLRDD